MIVGGKKVILADEISTGLDSSTTFQIVRCMQNMVVLRKATILMSLLQPAPETYDLFHDIMLIAEGEIICSVCYIQLRKTSQLQILCSSHCRTPDSIDTNHAAKISCKGSVLSI